MIHPPQSSSSSTTSGPTPQQSIISAPPLPPNRQSIPYLGQIRNNSSSGSNGSFNELSTTAFDLIQPSPPGSSMILMNNNNNNNETVIQSSATKTTNGQIMNGSKLSSSLSPQPSQESFVDSTFKFEQQQPTSANNNNNHSSLHNDDNDNSPVVYGELVILG